jgi:hypothetical protein
VTPVSAWLASLGAYFAADSHDPRQEPPPAPWRTMGELLDEPGVLSGRVDAVRSHLASAGGGSSRAPESVELRVAASVTHQGLAARTLSPLFALAVTGLRRAAPIGLRELRWQPTPGSMFALSIPGLDQARQPPNQGTGLHLEHLEHLEHLQHPDRPEYLEPLMVELCDAMRPFRVSPQVLRGNVASALNGARIALGTAEPGLAAGARAELDRLLGGSLLAGTSRTAPGGRFQRRNCCLIYRAATDRRGPVCGDCVLIGRRR